MLFLMGASGTYIFLCTQIMKNYCVSTDQSQTQGNRLQTDRDLASPSFLLLIVPAVSRSQLLYQTILLSATWMRQDSPLS